MEPVEGSSNFFTINHTNPQLVQMKVSTIIFQNGKNKLNNPNPQYFIFNTLLDTKPQKKNLTHSILIDMKYKINKGDMKSDRNNFF